MKKAIALLFIAALLVFTAGCDAGQGEKTTNEATAGVTNAADGTGQTAPTEETSGTSSEILLPRI